MRVDATALVAILAMALSTYLLRIGGLWLAGRLSVGKRAEAWMRALPGAVLVSLVVPPLLTGGPAEWVAALATVATQARTRNLLLALLAGVAAVYLLRTLGLR